MIAKKGEIEMRHYLTAGMMALAAVGLGALPAGAALLTIEQAVELSQRTGRPIFAVAGDVT